MVEEDGFEVFPEDDNNKLMGASGPVVVSQITDNFGNSNGCSA